MVGQERRNRYRSWPVLRPSAVTHRNGVEPECRVQTHPQSRIHELLHLNWLAVCGQQKDDENSSNGRRRAQLWKSMLPELIGYALAALRPNNERTK